MSGGRPSSTALPGAVPALPAGRTLLRPLRPEDASAVHGIIGDPLVCRYMPVPPSPSLAVSQEYVAACLREAATGLVLSWGVTLPGTSGPVGLVQASRRDGRIELGFFLQSGAWRRGLMSDALRGVLDWLGSRWQVPAVAICDAENQAASALLAKLGFRQDALAPPLRVHPACGPLPRRCILHRRLPTRPCASDAAPALDAPAAAP